MTRPGDRLRRLAARVCTERTRTRLVDPAVADLQAEFADARRNRSIWRRALVLGDGYLSIAKVLVIAAGGDLRQNARTWEREEARGARRGAWVALSIVIVASALLELPTLTLEYLAPAAGDRLWLAMYLAPSTLPLTVPLGLAVASAWILHGAARTRKMAVVALATAALTSAGMFVNLVWLTPEANQAFRTTVMAHYDPPVATPLRGENELRLWELRDHLRQARERGGAHDIRRLETIYYRKWTISAGPLAIVGLIVALAFRRQWTRAGLTGVACGVFAAHYALLMSTYPLAQSGMAPPIVLEWAGNGLCVAAALAITSSRRPASA